MAASDDIYLEIKDGNYSEKNISNDIVEQILVRLGVTDLIRWKRVCRSWKSLISSPAFIKAHMKYNYNKNNDTTRIIMPRSGYCRLRPSPKTYGIYDPSEYTFEKYTCNFLGSSNGLVCISVNYPDQLIVANPSTREVRKLPPFPFKTTTYYSLFTFCWGFGYDSSVDDYKLILGFNLLGGTESVTRTCFHVLSLRSNVWRSVGQVKYSCMTKVGTLCNGALHWFMSDVMKGCNTRRVIISFHLSKEEFKEIPQPDNAKYLCCSLSRVGVFQDCLCVYICTSRLHHRWVMKNYNVQQSWQLLPSDHVMKPYSAHLLKESMDYIPHKTSFFHGFTGSSNKWEYISAPLFVETLVSPHPNGTFKRKLLANNSNRSDKLIKGDGCATLSKCQSTMSN